MKKEKGITLIALIVTIIVLVILAGITIRMLTRENNIIDTAIEAREKNKRESTAEKVRLMLAAYVKEHRLGTQTLEEYLNEQKTKGELDKVTNNGDGTITVEEDGYKITIRESDRSIIKTEKAEGEGATDPSQPEDPDKPELPSGWKPEKVYAVTSADNKTVPVPIGFTVSETEKSVQDGLVIKQDGTENEFVWVPVANTSEMFGQDKDGNLLGKLYDFGTSAAPKDPPTAENWRETNGIMSWNNSSTGFREPDVVTQYDNSSSYYTDAGIVGITNATQFKEQLQNELKAMKESVERYGGFYIGRYETGNLSQNKAVVAKGNTDIANQNWYMQYQKNKTIAEGTGVTSSMIWGCQWDAVMKWFLEDDDTRVYVTNSTEKGNYAGTQEGGNRRIATGSNSVYSIKNIYDMAGNVCEWTVQATHAHSRVMRRKLLHH